MSQYKHERIFIIGHPGAGKALLAKTLAEKLGWEFIDADFGLENRIGRTMSEIIGKEGEDAFSHCQSEIIESLLSKSRIVVTTDASIVCDEKNKRLLSSELVVYLKVSMPVQIERTSHKLKPLLLSTDLSTFLDKLHHERDSLYDSISRITINSDDSALDEHVLRVVKVITKEHAQVTDALVLSKKDLVFFHKTLHIPIQLSEQQALCFKLLAEGKTSKEIARDMNLSYRTVEDYLAKAMELLGCNSSKELIALYHAQP